MILKIQYKDSNAVRNTIIDNIEKVDTGEIDGTSFINIYKNGRKSDDDFTTINIVGLSAFLMSNEGKTLEIFRSK